MDLALRQIYRRHIASLWGSQYATSWHMTHPQHLIHHLQSPLLLPDATHTMATYSMHHHLPSKWFNRVINESRRLYTLPNEDDRPFDSLEFNEMDLSEPRLSADVFNTRLSHLLAWCETVHENQNERLNSHQYYQLWQKCTRIHPFDSEIKKSALFFFNSDITEWGIQAPLEWHVDIQGSTRLNQDVLMMEMGDIITKESCIPMAILSMQTKLTCMRRLLDILARSSWHPHYRQFTGYLFIPRRIYEEYQEESMMTKGTMTYSSLSHHDASWKNVPTTEQVEFYILD